MTDVHTAHTVQSFDQDLKHLTAILLEMGELAGSQVRDATRALVERDEELAKEVVRREQALNEYDTRGMEAAIQLLAKRQPMGVDLRTIVVVLKGFTELERVGDEAKKIAKITRRMILEELDPLEVYRSSFSRMVSAAQDSLENALKALRNHDEDLAISVAEGDKLLDMEYKDALRAVHESVTSKPVLLPVAAEAVIIIKAVERIGDHAKNIAKHVVYLVEGKDVRHVKSKKLAEALGKESPGS